MEFRNLSGICLDLVLDAFEKAFCDYAVNFDRRQIESMLVRRGYDPQLSFAAFENGSIAGFLLNGTGVYGGKSSCYDCGTGTLPAFRGRGLAGRLFQESLPELIKNGIEQYVLEVLQSNDPAIAVYKKSGFEISADYDCYNKPISGLVLSKKPDAEITIKTADPHQFTPQPGFCDFRPSWQNDVGSIRRGAEGLLMNAAYHGAHMVAYCIFDPQTGDLAQIAVAPAYRRRGIASALLASMLPLSASATLKVLNVDKRCSSLPRFLESVNFDKGLSQYAMIRHLG